MSALPPDTLLRMNIDKSMGFGLQKYAGIKDMNLAIELPSGLQPLPRALNNPLNWFPTPIFIFASESRAIIDYDS